MPAAAADSPMGRARMLARVRPGTWPRLILLVLALAPLLFIPATPISGRWLSLITTAVVFAIGASGLGLLWGQAGYVTIAHSTVVGVGGYATAILVQDQGRSFLPTLALAMLAAALASVGISFAAMRVGGHYFKIMTFAIAQLAVVVAGQLDSITGGTHGMAVRTSGQVFLGMELGDRPGAFKVAVVMLIASLAVVHLVRRSNWGVMLRSIRDNETLAHSLGLNIDLHRSLVFAVAGLRGGVCGVMRAYQLRFIDPISFDLTLGIFFLLMVLVGGRLYLFGPTLGAAFYVFVPEFISAEPVRGQMVMGLVLILVILLLPEGLMSLVKRLAGIRDSRASVPEGDHGDVLRPEVTEPVSDDEGGLR